MRIRIAVFGCFICAVVLLAGHQVTAAKSKKSESGLKIGVVSVRKIYQDCKKVTRYRDETIAERNRIEAELEKQAKEIDAERAGLKTLKSGSNDYSRAVKEIMTKQARIQAHQKFYEQEMALKEQKIFEDIYKDILLQTTKVAEKKGLDLVFEKSEPELPAPSANELTLIISSYKLLYSAGCIDITDEVMAGVDASK